MKKSLNMKIFVASALALLRHKQDITTTSWCVRTVLWFTKTKPPT